MVKHALLAAVILLIGAAVSRAAPGEWREPRHDGTLTAIQPTPGAMRDAPVLLAEYDLGRTRPIPFSLEDGANLALVHGGLRSYDPGGRELWQSHPAGVTLTRVVAVEDLDADGQREVVLEASRPAQPYGVVIALSLGNGEEMCAKPSSQ